MFNDAFLRIGCFTRSPEVRSWCRRPQISGSLFFEFFVVRWCHCLCVALWGQSGAQDAPRRPKRCQKDAQESILGSPKHDFWGATCREWPLAKTSVFTMFYPHYTSLCLCFFTLKIDSGTQRAPQTLFFPLLCPLWAPKWAPRSPQGSRKGPKEVPKASPGTPKNH